MAAPVPGTPAWYRSRATPIPKPQPSSPKTPLVTAKKTDPATVFGTPQWVDARVSEQIDPQVQAIQDALKAQQAQNANYQSALTGYYKALGGVLQNEAPAVSAAYNSAAQGIGQVAQGYTQGLAQQYQNEAQTVQAALERAGQQQAIPSSVALANPGTDPFYAMHGAIPASTLAQQGAAAATDAAAQPRIWAARGADALTVAVQKAMEGDQAMQSKIADIYASVPAVRQKIEDSVRQYQLDAQKLKVDQQQAQQKLALDQYKADTSYDAKIRAINASIAKNNAALQQKSLDRQTRVAIANQNADLARQRIAIQQQKLAASGAGSDVSPSQNNAALNAAQKAAHSALDATAARIWAGVPNSNLDPNSDDPKVQAKLEAATAEFQRRMDMNFGTAMARTINAIGPYLKKIGYSSAQIKAQAYKYVTTGFTSGDGTLTRFQPPKGYKPPNPSDASVAPKAAGAVQIAAQYLGTPYKFGSGPDTTSFDCSDLVQYAYAQMGIKIPRTTFDQIKAGRAVNYRSPADLRPGDLVFPSTHHVVMYVGDGKVIAAPRTGTVVQYQNLSDFGKPVAVRRIV